MPEQNNDKKHFPENAEVTIGGVGTPTSSPNADSAGETQQTSTKMPTDAAEIVADGDSRAIASKNEGSWPPLKIRDEIVEAAEQEKAKNQQDQA